MTDKKTTKLTITRNYRDDGMAPLYLQYPQQTSPQPAFVSINEDGKVLVSSNSEIGSAIPMDAWNGCVRRYDIPNDLSADGIDELLDDITPLLERIADGLSVGWDGSNNVGALTADAQDADNELSYNLYNLEADKYDRAEITETYEWLQYAHPADVKEGAESWTEVTAEDIEEDTDYEGVYLSDDVQPALNALQSKEEKK